MIALLQQDPLAFFLAFAALVFSLVLHELGHAYSAYLFGDPTAKRQGRITLNPLKHLDPLGTVLLLFVGFGWARPVPVNPAAFSHYRLGLFVVSIAGIVINLVLAVLFALLVRGLYAVDPLGVALTFQGEGQTPLGLLALALFFASSINLVLAIFNLLPIPPLDGSKILQSLLPLSWQPLLWRLEQYAWLSFLLILTVLRGPIQEVLRLAREVFFGFFFG
ncbi:site-2 protease family protein [Thermus thermamylovorans]|uniref:Site-2 protease family protein n=1 Tax=Thermus thermamylovorans TaxID=2509362 RepID=A0A4Q9B620_9DEIN|nr:site-2 protease family protein [Thermus thermamylovorans]TBH21083.1 site-2 protease family protein [Thermus thermamylovorans]